MTTQMALPPGVSPGKGWRRVTTKPTYATRSFTTIQSPMDIHREKAFGIFSSAPNPGRMPVFVPGFGEMWTEDMKELILRWEEKQLVQKTEIDEKRRNRIEMFRETAIEMLAARMEQHRRNPISDPAPLKSGTLRGLY